VYYKIPAAEWWQGFFILVSFSRYQ